MELINQVAALVGPRHVVDLNNPQVTIHIEVIHTVVGISVLTEFNQLKRFNLEQIVAQVDEKEDEIQN